PGHFQRGSPAQNSLLLAWTHTKNDPEHCPIGLADCTHRCCRWREEEDMRKIDVFNHIFPVKFFERMVAEGGPARDMEKRVRNIPVLWDLDRRFQVLEEFGDEYQQVLSIASPPIEAIAGPKVAVELARLANDGMAELVDRYPE